LGIYSASFHSHNLWLGLLSLVGHLGLVLTEPEGFLDGRLALVGLGRAQNVMDAVYASDSWRILGFTAARIAKQLKVIIYQLCME